MALRWALECNGLISSAYRDFLESPESLQQRFFDSPRFRRRNVAGSSLKSDRQSFASHVKEMSISIRHTASAGPVVIKGLGFRIASVPEDLRFPLAPAHTLAVPCAECSPVVLLEFAGKRPILASRMSIRAPCN
jgi:hypothetical protein